MKRAFLPQAVVFSLMFAFFSQTMAEEFSADNAWTNPTNHSERIESHIYRYQNSPIFLSRKIPEFLEKPPLSIAVKHPDFQVTV